MTALLICMRLLQFLAAGVVFGSALFFVYGPGAPRASWPRRMLLTAASLGSLGAAGWLMGQAGLLFSDPAQAFSPASVWSVVADTGFGAAAGGRLALFVLALAVCAASGRDLSRGRLLVLAGLGGLAAASFAWTGHGAAGEGPAGALHAAADVLHLVAACAWTGALFALAGLALGGSPTAHAGMAAFSGVGPAVVAVLVLTGLVNSWFLVGPGHLEALVSSPYGRLLSLKLVLFAAMLGLAAVNRWVVTPRLAAAPGPRGLPASLLAETLLAMLVLACVAWLGTLPPPAEA